jgi:3',5'-cyclic AMP phosphodiesterase CpdA
MRTIVHLSDLHFGRVHRPALDPLAAAIAAIKPDLVAVSGDLTQRARVSQFREARAFLDGLPARYLVVPGNHDVPLYNVALRFGSPLGRYRRWITDDLTPSVIDEEMAVLGINTTRALVQKGGRVNERQVSELCAEFDGVAGDQTRIVVTHHPFDLPEGASETNLVGRARMAMAKFAKCGVDLFLSGHLHLTRTGSTARYKIPGYAALVVQAGTAISTRQRGEENSFNLIRIERPKITVESHVWQPAVLRFALTESAEFRHSSAEGWTSAA